MSAPAWLWAFVLFVTGWAALLGLGWAVYAVWLAFGPGWGLLLGVGLVAGIGGLLVGALAWDRRD